MARKKQQTTKGSWWQRMNARRRAFMARRPHRSFRLTRRRDYRRSLVMPGYFAFTKEVVQFVRAHARLLLGLAALYAVLGLVLSIAISQDTYRQLDQLITDATEGNPGSGVAGVLSIFWGVTLGQLTQAAVADPSSQVIAMLLALFVWLSTIWLLRAIMKGYKPRIRDGIYSSGSPVIALFVLALIFFVQMIPAGLAMIAYTAADGSGLLQQTAMLMLFGGAALLLITTSLYWATSTFVAMIIVTLPGTYPFEALRLAGDLVIGRRMRLLMRIAWAFLLLFLLWAIVLIPVILLDGALKNALPDLLWLPLVPAIAMMLMALSVVLLAVYLYLLYRKVVADDSAPA